MKKCILESHRGVCTEAPDNTMAAFRLAVKQGYEMIELDTKFTKDGVCVVLHDRTVNRTGRNADGSEIEPNTRIDSLTLEEAKQLDFGLWCSEKYRGERIPTFEEVLALSKESGIPLKLDNVWHVGHNEEQQDALLDIIEKTDSLDNVGFTVFNIDAARKVLSRFPTAQLHYDGMVTDETLAELSSVVPHEQLTVWQRMDNTWTSWCKVPPADAKSVEKIKRVGKLGLWLLKTQDEFIQAVEQYGADVVETDGSLKPVK